MTGEVEYRREAKRILTARVGLLSGAGLEAAWWLDAAAKSEMEPLVKDGLLAWLSLVVERLRSWYAEPPAMQGVRPYRLEEMLERTLALYQGL